MSNEIILEDFANPLHEWTSLNDPVMGGQSYSTISIKDDVGVFDGEVVDVSFLKAPGFITMRGEGNYADVSSCDHLRMTARASEAYDGYRISFGRKIEPGSPFPRGFKADFKSPLGTEMVNIDIPFTDFTVNWDGKTGDAITTCEEDASFCPDTETLQNMHTISVWGEGVDGKVKLEVASIKGIGCTADGTSPAAEGTSPAATTTNTHSSTTTLSPSFFIGVAVAAFFGAVVSGLFAAVKHNYKSLNEADESATMTTPKADIV